MVVASERVVQVGVQVSCSNRCSTTHNKGLVLMYNVVYCSGVLDWDWALRDMNGGLVKLCIRKGQA